ncbi:glucoamylase [Candidatus Aminicenantes bacterium AC-335-A11]|jgi:GH15 family glucan-1,4-alpha-glucosidase|nr:glucoamylase [SCandidatus Aminicenantes bacterium Aminicenantia_JdfR_composite]MCP2596977.1 glucoamylase [Candidatus Aminicenantes bacterium AC-335-G13]MCP2605931.1 glucoamylase [Candidatus Aminicenantes bacterium AC-708-I09]MCP2618270.1 glucoamylase [Candidatus Aminicenantes bacterium AC-335-A11]
MIDIQKAEGIYKKSIEVLRAVQLKNGGCLATPKGERYPYIYPRDHAVILLGFLSAGHYKRMKRGLEFIFDCQLKSGAFPQRIDKNGNDASYKPIQIDGTGLVLYSMFEYVNQTNDLDFAKAKWENIMRAVKYIICNIDEDRNLVYTPNSIHEFPPTEQGLEIWANCVCWSALRRMYALSEKIQDIRREWHEYANRVKKGILKNMWNSRLGSFVKTIRLKESSSVLVDTDASAYAVAEFGVLPDNDGRVISMVADIEKKLWNRELGGICRYQKYEGRNNGGWGPWPHFTLMICRHYIRRKNKRKADKYFNWVLNIAYNDLLPEHIATVKEFEEYVTDFSEAGLLRKDRLIMIENARKNPMFKKGLAYITIPLAWPHSEFIRTYNLYKKVFLEKEKSNF